MIEEHAVCNPALFRIHNQFPALFKYRPRRQGMSELTTPELVLHDAYVPALTTLYALLRNHPPNTREASAMGVLELLIGEL